VPFRQGEQFAICGRSSESVLTLSAISETAPPRPSCRQGLRASPLPGSRKVRWVSARKVKFFATADIEMTGDAARYPMLTGLRAKRRISKTPVRSTLWPRSEARSIFPGTPGAGEPAADVGVVASLLPGVLAVDQAARQAPWRRDPGGDGSARQGAGRRPSGLTLMPACQRRVGPGARSAVTRRSDGHNRDSLDPEVHASRVGEWP
jgi:hypothetical protein